ncbi:hypothetical protein K458DRAFT_389850 [Lentithecium fluviatile CBS 122367]|uniref:Uncharacterized protein n=1 Tax=Lentithecium fluviatile CBS 122367 TaxID=1168545 RepID=A0A6G1IYB4_9PLEO|nr:hypothetical protein K458DRAFT_389850 [Lentithecium fluviatile CBS 122367]
MPSPKQETISETPTHHEELSSRGPIHSHLAHELDAIDTAVAHLGLGLQRTWSPARQPYRARLPAREARGHSFPRQNDSFYADYSSDERDLHRENDRLEAECARLEALLKAERIKIATYEAILDTFKSAYCEVSKRKTPTKDPPGRIREEYIKVARNIDHGYAKACTTDAKFAPKAKLGELRCKAGLPEKAPLCKNNGDDLSNKLCSKHESKNEVDWEFQKLEEQHEWVLGSENNKLSPYTCI